MNSAEKALALLKLLARKPYTFGVSELAERMDGSKSGTFKLLSALVNQGFAAQTADRKYTLGIAGYLVGKSYEEHVGLARFVKPYVTRLRDLTDENASFSMLVNGETTQIYREESKQNIRLVGPSYATRPINAGAAGKLLAAYEEEESMRRRLMAETLTAYTQNTITSPMKLLEEFAAIRGRGYSVSTEEFAPGSAGIAVPVMSREGRVWGALAVGLPVIRLTEEKKGYFVYLLSETARALEKELNEDSPRSER